MANFYVNHFLPRCRFVPKGILYPAAAKADPVILPPPPAPLPSKLQKKRKKNVDELIKKMRKRRVQTAREIDVARAAIDLSTLPKDLLSYFYVPGKKVFSLIKSFILQRTT